METKQWEKDRVTLRGHCDVPFPLLLGQPHASFRFCQSQRQTHLTSYNVIWSSSTSFFAIWVRSVLVFCATFEDKGWDFGVEMVLMKELYPFLGLLFFNLIMVFGFWVWIGFFWFSVEIEVVQVLIFDALVWRHELGSDELTNLEFDGCWLCFTLFCWSSNAVSLLLLLAFLLMIGMIKHWRI